MVRTACQQASGWGAFGVDRYMHLLRSMVLVCLVNDTQARGALGPRLETITRLGLTVAFIIGLHGHGPMVCLELSALGMSRFHNDKMAELSRLLDYEFPVGHSEYACKLHKMSEVPSVIGAEHNGHPVSKNMRMTLVSPVALCRLLPRLARLPSFKKDNLLQHWLHGGVGSPLEFVLMRDFRRLPEDPTALEMLVSCSPQDLRVPPRLPHVLTSWTLIPCHHSMSVCHRHGSLLNQGYPGTIAMKMEVLRTHATVVLGPAMLALVPALVLAVQAVVVPAWVRLAVVQVLVGCPGLWPRHAQFPRRPVSLVTHPVSCSAHAAISHTTAARRASEVTVRAISTRAVSGGPRYRPRHRLVRIATEQHPCAALDVGQ